jgi:electron transfer flavoprotein beta subunit
MNIVALVKRVPVTTLAPKVGADRKSIDPSGVEYMTSFYDEIAVEEAVKTKEALGAGEVTVLTIGAKGGTKEIRECLAKGADKAVLMVDEDWGSRGCFATAKALAAKLDELKADLVFAGRVATDRDNAAVGPMVAALLGWGCVTDAVEVAVADGKVTVKREAEAGVETYVCDLPAIITCQKDLNEPRYAGLKGIMAAKKKPLEEVECPATPAQSEVLRLELPPERAGGRIVGSGVEAVPALIDALRNEAGVL